jgi:hypothetical protein
VLGPHNSGKTRLLKKVLFGARGGRETAPDSYRCTGLAHHEPRLSALRPPWCCRRMAGQSIGQEGAWGRGCQGPDGAAPVVFGFGCGQGEAQTARSSPQLVKCQSGCQTNRPMDSPGGPGGGGGQDHAGAQGVRRRDRGREAEAP